MCVCVCGGVPPSSPDKGGKSSSPNGGIPPSALDGGTDWGGVPPSSPSGGTPSSSDEGYPIQFQQGWYPRVPSLARCGYPINQVGVSLIRKKDGGNSPVRKKNGVPPSGRMGYPLVGKDGIPLLHQEG